jgi:DNA recombination protein RmuC
MNNYISLLAGALLGALLAWLWTRSRSAALAERLAAAERTAGELPPLRDGNEKLKVRLGEIEQRLRSETEKLSWIDGARKEMENVFKALASDALRENSGQAIADARDKVVTPLADTLDRLDRQVREMESKREGAYGELARQLGDIQRTNTELTRTTTTLSQALKDSGVRGRWGEMQLRRVVELAGLAKHVDFTEQEKAEEGRPDMVVRLPNGGCLPVDAKANMTAYLEALSAPDDKSRKAKMDEHGKRVREQVRKLGEKKYWEQFESAPEFVVMFIPVESSLSAAFESQPTLMEYAMESRVLLATPVTLLALLKAVAFGWQQQNVAMSIREIERECKELHARLIPFVEHVRAMGSGLENAVDAYNRGVGSLKSRILPVAERIKALGAGSGEMPEPAEIEDRPRKADL